MHPVERELIELIRAKGPISFAKFMELSLYSKNQGYYSSKNPIGKFGDYYTSPHTHPLFGWTIGTQIYQMWQLLNFPNQFYLIESGSGNGMLGQTILDSIKLRYPNFFDHILYIGIDRRIQNPSIGRTLSFIQSSTIPLKPVVGCIISNELFDSFPVHRFKIINGHIKELFIDWSSKFIPVYEKISNENISKQIGSNMRFLPEGYEGEVCLTTNQWMQTALEIIEQGYLLTIDYGYLKEELYNVKRKTGTIQSYYNHSISYNFFENVGTQDITSHVDFTEIIELGKLNDASLLGYTTQSKFIKNLGGRLYLKALKNESNKMDSFAYNNNQFAMNSLMDTNGLGNFKVLVQGKNIENQPLWGFDPENTNYLQMKSNPENIPVLYMDETYMPLLKGRYPHSQYENPKSWIIY